LLSGERPVARGDGLHRERGPHRGRPRGGEGDVQVEPVGGAGAGGGRRGRARGPLAAAAQQPPAALRPRGRRLARRPQPRRERPPGPAVVPLGDEPRTGGPARRATRSG